MLFMIGDNLTPTLIGFVVDCYNKYRRNYEYVTVVTQSGEKFESFVGRFSFTESKHPSELVVVCPD